MRDRITVRGLTLRGTHGVMPEERVLGQPFILHLTAELSLAGAQRSDNLEDTISYADMVEVARNAFSSRHFKLIEAVAGAVADALMARFKRIERLEVTIEKPHAPIDAVFETVSVTVGRTRHD